MAGLSPRHYGLYLHTAFVQPIGNRPDPILTAPGWSDDKTLVDDAIVQADRRVIADVKGQESGIRALEIGVADGCDTLLKGRPVTGNASRLCYQFTLR